MNGFFEKPRTMSIENAFLSGKGLPSFPEYQLKEIEMNEKDEIEMHFEEGFQDSILANIYKKSDS